MKEQILKLDVIWWGQVKSGIKNYEIRNNDRNFQVGDILKLKKYSSKAHRYMRTDEEFTGMAIEAIDVYCTSSYADTITAKVTSIITAKDFNTEMSQMLEIVKSGGEIFLNPDRIKYFSKIIQTGKEFFQFEGKTNDFRLPDGYVVLGIEVQNE